MDHDTQLAALLKQADENAKELDRTIAAIQELGDLPVAFSRDALVEELGFDFAAKAPAAINPTMLGALRA